MIQAAPPAPPAPVVLARSERSEAVATSDRPLVLVKAGRAERAVVRRQLFTSVAVWVTAPTAAAGEPRTCRWRVQARLQRQVCFSSMTGLFACTEPETAEVPDAAAGEAPLLEAHPLDRCGEALPAVAQAVAAVRTPLSARAEALFDADDRAELAPLWRAAGVVARPDAPAGAAPKPAAAPGPRGRRP